MLLLQLCCKDLVGSGSWQKHFTVNFFWFLLIINAIAVVLSQIRECGFLVKRLTLTNIFDLLKFVLDGFIYVSGFTKNI